MTGRIDWPAAWQFVRIPLGLLAVIAVVTTFSACTAEPDTGPPVATESSPPVVRPSGVIVLPDNDRVEVRTVCDHGNRLYVTYGQYNGEPIDVKVIPQDPSCKETPQ